MNTQHVTTLGTDIYAPSIRKITKCPHISDLQISNKRVEYERQHRHVSTYSLPPPEPTPLRIQTQKSSIQYHSAFQNMIHDSSYKDNKSNNRDKSCYS